MSVLTGWRERWGGDRLGQGERRIDGRRRETDGEKDSYMKTGETPGPYEPLCPVVGQASFEELFVPVFVYLYPYPIPW